MADLPGTTAAHGAAAEDRPLAVDDEFDTSADDLSGKGRKKEEDEEEEEEAEERRDRRDDKEDTEPRDDCCCCC